MTLMKGYVGSGILALPYAFNQGGWLLSSVILITCTGLMVLCVHALLDLADDCKKPNAGLSELSDFVFGFIGVFVTRTFLVSY